jgi:chemotaxis signal transduction protein
MDLVTFAVADLSCAIDLRQVDEVLAMPGVTPLPDYTSRMLGAIDLHGTAVPVVDLHHLLGCQPVGIRPDQHLLVLTCARGRLAARCDRVEGLLSTSLQPSTGAESASGLVLGLVSDIDRLRIVLDAEALIDSRPGSEAKYPVRREA